VIHERVLPCNLSPSINKTLYVMHNETCGAGSGAGMGATSEESSCRKMSKSLVRWGEAEKGKSVS
jgi:hypothetical protein